MTAIPVYATARATPGARSFPAPSVGFDAAPGLLARLLAAMAIRRSRRSLAALDDHLLADLGLTREQALREAARPALADAWDAPAHWLR